MSGERSLPEIGVGLIGYAFMGRAHAHAYRALATLSDAPLQPRLDAVAGRDAGRAGALARRFAIGRVETDWRALIAGERIGLIDNCGPNGLHAEPSIAAAEAGKHVVCEKPLGRDANESYEVWRRVAATGVVHMCAFNYRFVPAVRLARELIAGGELGEIHHFRARYLQDWGLDASLMTWRFDRAQAGSGALGDLGAHVVDLGRHLVGEITAVSGATRTFVRDRSGRRVDVDDAFAATAELDGGAIGTLEASRVAPGRRNGLAFEVNGSKGSLTFDLERINELRLYVAGSTPGAGAQGFRDVLVTDAGHPFAEHWWPPGHVLGWEHTFVHELHHLLSAIRDGISVAPLGADFEAGYRAAEVCDAIARSAQSGVRERVRYRGLGA